MQKRPAAAQAATPLRSAPPPSSGALHLSSLRAFLAHWEEDKVARYVELLRDFGIDPSRLDLLPTGPRVWLAEQPGNWIYPEDALRVGLLRALIEEAPLHPSSGVRTLTRDRFSTGAVKRWLTTLWLHPGLGPTPLMSATVAARWRGSVYHAIPLAGGVGERLREIFELGAALAEAAALSPERYAQAARASFLAGPSPAERSLLPADQSARALLATGRMLEAYDRAAAAAQLRGMAAHLEVATTFTELWNRINADFAGLPVRPLEPGFNRMVLAIEDPLRAARALARWTGAQGAVPLVGIETAEGKYRLVHCDPDTEQLFLADGLHRGPIAWGEVLELAREGRTGGPSVILEYLMMAAQGVYLIADRDDGLEPFEQTLRDIHERYLGLPWPSLSLPGDCADASQTLFDVFSRRREEEQARALEQFFVG